jgi:hypothetical protein
MFVVATPVTGQSNTPCADVVSVHKSYAAAVEAHNPSKHNVYSVAAMPRGIRTQRVAAGQRLVRVFGHEVKPLDLD